MKTIHIGVLSGTSMDAVDAAAFCFERAYAPVARHSMALPDELRSLIKKVQAEAHATSLASLAALNRQIGVLFADCINALLKKNPSIGKKDIRAVGALEQTVIHRPYDKPAFTWQAGDANIIAKRTGLLTVADFRRADMALGGQGAPLASCFHRLAFERKDQKTAVVNIGGIANLSLLAGDGSVFGFDCGPGNCMMDGWIQRHKRQAYDHDGRWASEAAPSEELLRQLMNHPFVRRQAPKSACAQDFSLDWLDQCRQRVPPLPAAAVQASLMMFTAACIARSVHGWLGNEQDNTLRVVLCGGGTRNGALLKAIRQQLRGTVQLSDEYGVPAQWVEAAVCAWLAKQRLDGEAGSLPQTTGIKKPATLGAVYR